VAFKDLGDWAELGGLKFPIGGKVYAVPPVSAELGPRLEVVVSVGIDVAKSNELGERNQEVLDDLGERDLYRDVLGPAYGEMVADEVPWPALKHAALTVMMDAVYDRETAEAFWESLGKPEPARKKPADRLPMSWSPEDPKVTEIKTRQASTGGTKPRKSSAAAARRGSRSSNTGS
jgi:hypothetical protein